jgi:hypothetical protein
MAHKQWTTEELETLLIYQHLSDEDLAARPPGRSVGAIAAARETVHAYHTGACQASTSSPPYSCG